MKILILYSGGLDSLIMRLYAQIKYPQADVLYVWYDIGQEYARKEEAVLPFDVIKHKLQWLDVASSEVDSDKESLYKDIFIPGRNLVLAVNAACKYLPDEIWIGALLGETHLKATDKNYTFLNHINETLEYVLSPFKKVNVRFPLADVGFNKLTALKWALANGLSHSDILDSSSCLSGEDGNCGHCVVCFRRWGIFKQLGIPPELYNVHPLEQKCNEDIAREMVYGTYYDHHRKSEILPALPDWFLSKIQPHNE